MENSVPTFVEIIAINSDVIVNKLGVQYSVVFFNELNYVASVIYYDVYFVNAILPEALAAGLCSIASKAAGLVYWNDVTWSAFFGVPVDLTKLAIRRILTQKVIT